MDRHSAAPVRRLQFANLLRMSPQAIIILDAEGQVREWNAASETLLGWTREDLVGQSFEVVLAHEDRLAFFGVWQGLKAQRRAISWISDWLQQDRSWLPVELMMAPIQDNDGSFAGVVATLTLTQPEASAPAPPEVDCSRAGEAAVSSWEVDEVTALPGRRWLQRRLLAELAPGCHRAVAILDVDAFALVNQVYGPESGDQVLAELAGRFIAVSGPAVIGRWQADEFVFILDGVSAGEELESLLELAAGAARGKFVLAQDEIRLTVSVGWTTSATVALALLFRSASAAMESAKAHGRDRIAVFEPASMPATVESGLRMAHDLQRALVHDELRLHYQPIIDLATNDVVGVESLLRWERPGVGLLTPATFIDVAERTGQIVALGEWVIATACRTSVALAARVLTPVRVSVNVSARQLSDPGFLRMLRAALESSGCDPGSLVIEVTETALVHDMGGAAAVLEQVRDLGLEVDLDDFGTGYSSLLYLKHFPVDRIKLDQSFVAGLGSDVADTAIVTSTIALAHSMGITAIAEGVETAEQLGLLRQMGCDCAQGYLLSHPLPFPELVEWLTEQTTSRLLDRGAAAGADRPPPRSSQDSRDHIADTRDLAGDLRDRAGDIRDRAADLRDGVGDFRDGVRDRREGSDLGVAETTAERSRAAEDRARAAVERGAARLERDVAEVDRGTERSARDRAGATGSVAHPGRLATATGPSARLDALTGALPAASGLPALEAETEQSRAAGDSVTVISVELAGHDPAGRPVDQLAQDRALVAIANVLGAALRPQDLLIRTDVRTLVCLLRGLPAHQIESRLSVVGQELAVIPNLPAALLLGHAVLRAEETVGDLLARAAGSRRRD